MTPPEIYYEWALALDVLKEGIDDKNVVEAMKAGKLYWQEGVADRFAKLLEETVNERLDRAMDKFDKILETSDTDALLKGITETRKEFLFLKDAVSLNTLPADIVQAFTQHIVDFSAQVQSSLEDSAAQDTTGQLLSQIRNNPISIG